MTRPHLWLVTNGDCASEPVEPAIDPTAAAAEARVLLEALASQLPALERAILLAHVRDGVPLSELARRFNLTGGQERQIWKAIKDWLRTGCGVRPRES